MTKQDHKNKFTGISRFKVRKAWTPFKHLDPGRVSLVFRADGNSPSSVSHRLMTHD